MGWALLGLLLGLLLAEILIQCLTVRVVTAMVENSPPFRVESLPPDSDAERFETQTSDGLMIRGSIYRHADRVPRGLIVFCHEYGSNHWSAMLYSTALWKAGFDVLAFDFRNLGESDTLPGYQPLHWLTQYEVSDLLAVLDYVQQRADLRDLPLGLFGISRGGCAALHGAAVRSEVRCVACESSFTTQLMCSAHARRWLTLAVPERLAKLVPWWHVEWTLILSLWVSQRRRGCRYAILERVLPKLRDKPLLLIAGERDSYVPVDVPHKMACLAGQPQAVWAVPHAKHNLARLVNPDEYDKHLTQFFATLDNGATVPPQAMDTNAARSQQTASNGQ